MQFSSHSTLQQIQVLWSKCCKQVFEVHKSIASTEYKWLDHKTSHSIQFTSQLNDLIWKGIVVNDLGREKAKPFKPKGKSLVNHIKYNVSVEITNCFNPNTFAGLVGKVQKKLSPKGGRKGGWRNPGLEPGTCRVLGEGPQLHARGAV